METLPDPLQDYQLLTLLGDGRSGLVYLASDNRTGEFVAIKQFPLGSEAAQSFFRELSFLFTLRHPHVIACENLIYSPRGKSCLVLEYAEHGSLRNLLNQHPQGLPLEVVSQIARQIGAALLFAHKNQIVHCDVKPENILVCQSEGEKLFKLADLGIAVHENSQKLPSCSGSPQYMAPEQFYDFGIPASDFYSLGLVLAECLTGKMLFDHPDPRQIFLAHRAEAVDLEAIQCARWRSVLRRLLSHSPAERPTGESEVLSLWDEADGMRTGGVNSGKKPGKNFARPRLRPFVETQVAYTLSLTGITSVFNPELAGGREIWLCDGNSIDVLGVKRASLRRSVWHGRFIQGLPATPTHPAMMLFTDGLHEYMPANNRLRRLAQMPSGTQTMVRSERGYISASATHIHGVTSDFTVAWSLSLPNYIISPVLLALPGGNILAGSGPASPALWEISSGGEEIRRTKLPGTLLAAFHDPASGCAKAIIQSDESEGGASLHLIEGTGDIRFVKNLSHLPIYRAAFHGEFLTLFSISGEILFYDLEGSILGTIPASGNPVGDAWIPERGAYVLLRQDRGRSMIDVHAMQIFQSFSKQKILTIS